MANHGQEFPQRWNLHDLISHIFMDQHLRVRPTLAAAADRSVRTEIEVDQADPLSLKVHVIDCKRTRPRRFVSTRWSFLIVKTRDELSGEEPLIVTPLVEEGL